jgi:uncharacterized membrane protein YvlD (DUF360 family)
MGNFFKTFIQYMLVSYFVLTLFSGIQIPDSVLYLVASLAILSIGMLLVSPVLKFLTVRENFITTFILSTLISIAMFFLLDSFMTGFYIEPYSFQGLEMGTVIINGFEMTPTLTIVSASITASFVGSLLFVLEKSS